MQGANVLVNVAVFMAACAKTPGAKLAALWAPIAAFVALGLEHSVANMFLLPLGVLVGGDITWSAVFVGNLVPVTLGNAVGALVFTAFALLSTAPGGAAARALAALAAAVRPR